MRDEKRHRGPTERLYLATQFKPKSFHTCPVTDTHPNLSAIPTVNIFKTRKSSCVNARGIPPARGRKMLTPPRLDLTPPLSAGPDSPLPPSAGPDHPPPSAGPDPPPSVGPDPPLVSWTWPPPPAGSTPPQVWTDKQSETITFPSYYVRGR